VDIPVTIDVELTIAPNQCVTRQQALYTTEECLLSRRRVVREIIWQRRIVKVGLDRLGLDKSFDFRTEVK